MTLCHFCDKLTELNTVKTKMATPEANPPATLYRGVTIPADRFSKDLVTADLTPGNAPVVGEDGGRVDETGNEHGVYMSDNPHMVDRSYAAPSTGDSIDDSPVFSTRHRSHIKVETPRVGVLHAVDTDGLPVRRPKISDVMQGVHNNGFKGNEWIADRVPAGNHRVSQLKLGSDLLHPEQVIEVGDDVGLDEAISRLEAEIAKRAGRLALAREAIKAMPAHDRHDWRSVERVLADIPEPSEERD